jgi:hypothetical protein
LANKDEMTIDILDDGTIRFETSPISGPIHASAEKFLADVKEATGGDQNRARRGHAPGAHHHHHHEQKH